MRTCDNCGETTPRMTMNPLVFLRSTTVYPVPPVCSVFWTPDDWQRTSSRVTEPLTLVSLGYLWGATGERDAHGRLLYRVLGPWRTK